MTKSTKAREGVTHGTGNVFADQFALGSAWKVELLDEDISRIDGVAVAGIVVAFTRVVSPSRIIVKHGGKPPLSSSVGVTYAATQQSLRYSPMCAPATI